jgi:hypothetical protein
LRDEGIANTETLLRKLMEGGKIVETLPTLAQSRAGLAEELGHLSDLQRQSATQFFIRTSSVLHSSGWQILFTSLGKGQNSSGDSAQISIGGVHS